LAGPLTLIVVVGVWVLGLVLGFSLVYLGHYPDEFRTSMGVLPAPSHEFANVLYFSFATLTTLGYGDPVPATAFTRGTATTQALLGFGLLTASVSSIVLLFPALSRMRLLAREVSHVVKAERHTAKRISDVRPEVLGRLARDVASTRIDLMHFPILIFFASSDEEASIARWTADLERMAREACGPESSPQAQPGAERARNRRRMTGCPIADVL
jgi:hypothetical protein